MDRPGRRRSLVVPLGTVAVLAAGFTTGCGGTESDAYCVTEQTTGGQPEYVVVDEGRCNGADHTTWIVYSSNYPHTYRPGDRIPAGGVGTRIRSTDTGARAAHGFTRTGAIPARGGFGTHGGGSGG